MEGAGDWMFMSWPIYKPRPDHLAGQCTAVTFPNVTIESSTGSISNHMQTIPPTSAAPGCRAAYTGPSRRFSGEGLLVFLRALWAWVAFTSIVILRRVIRQVRFATFRQWSAANSES